jgi:hypothetical protein
MSITGLPKKASLAPAKCSQPKCAAQQITAEGVSERSPVRQPRRKQRRSSVMAGNPLSWDASTLTYQRSFQTLFFDPKADQHP